MSHVCSQHLFGLPLRMNGMYRMQFDHEHLDLLPLVIWSRVLTIYRVKLRQRTAMEQKRIDLQSLSPTLPNLWLLLPIIIIIREKSLTQHFDVAMTSLSSDKDKKLTYYIRFKMTKYRTKVTSLHMSMKKCENMLNKQFCPDGVWLCV